MGAQTLIVGEGIVAQAPRAPKRRQRDGNEALLAPLLTSPETCAQGLELARVLPWEEIGRTARWALTAEAWREWAIKGGQCLFPPEISPLLASDWPVPRALDKTIGISSRKDGSVFICGTIGKVSHMELSFVRIGDYLRVDEIRFAVFFKRFDRWGHWKKLALKPGVV
jgi:hypothetical protein